MEESVAHDELTGRCLCSEVCISLQGARPNIDVCHCSMCRQWSGTFFSGVSADAFSIQGEENVRRFRSSEWAERAFCRSCGSNLWFRFLPADHYSFLAGLFDLPSAFAIEQQIFCDEKPHWYDLAQNTKMKTGTEVIAEAKAAGFTFD